jgi:hypothetical protein
MQGRLRDPGSPPVVSERRCRAEFCAYYTWGSATRPRDSGACLNGWIRSAMGCALSIVRGPFLRLGLGLSFPLRPPAQQTFKR